MSASRSAAWAVLRGEGPRTAISTSGVWPAFCSSPLTAVTVIPLRSCFVVIPVAAATRRIVDLRVGDLPHRARVRRERLQEPAAVRRERLAEVERRARGVGGRAARRGEVAEHDACDEAADEKPPAGDDRAAEAAEVDLLLGVAIRGQRLGHRAATLPEAHSH